MPASKAWFRFIPKPRPTTEVLRSKFVALWSRLMNGYPMVRHITNPNYNANGGSIYGVRQKTNEKAKNICLVDWFKLVNI